MLYSPWSLVVVLCPTFVSTLVTVTAAPETTPPEASRTVPTNVPESTCDRAVGVNRPAKTEPATIVRTRLRRQKRKERRGNIEDLPERKGRGLSKDAQSQW